jgi:hypothetical protein
LSKSNKVVEVPTETDDTILNDQLFLPEDLMPIDEGEVYGDMVQLYPYGPNQGEAQYMVQHMHLVPCVPYRRRSTQWGYYEHMGDEALKIYGSTAKSPSKFHPWVVQKLFGPVKRASQRKNR